MKAIKILAELFENFWVINERRIGLFALVLLNPYTIDLVVRRNLIILEYLWPCAACSFLINIPRNSNFQKIDEKTAKIKKKDEKSNKFWQHYTNNCQIDSITWKNLTISALIFGFGVHENPRCFLFMAFAGLIILKKIEFPVRMWQIYIAMVIAFASFWMVLAWLLNNRNWNFAQNLYYHRITALSPYPEANFVWEIFHSIAARYRPLLYFIYCATHMFMVTPCFRFFERLVESCAKYPEMLEVINPFSVQYCYVTFVYWNFNPSPEAFEWILALLVLSENRACYIVIPKYKFYKSWRFAIPN